ncbi:phosphopantetheine-binding protein [[Kitasatospora] papulosa]|jgi:acyl carrier protein|uniref:phosphopantetheine-binding protein n=1 Tax=Streptomyces TaxID=1883 RepID=UPI003424B9B3
MAMAEAKTVHTGQSEDAYASALLTFIGKEFLQGDQQAQLDADTPLMETGILDSLRVALLLSFIRDELGLHVSPAKLDTRHFKDVRTIAGMLAELAVDTAAEGSRA